MSEPVKPFTSNILKKLLYKNIFLHGLFSVLAISTFNFLITRMFPQYIPMSLFLSAVVIATWAGGKKSGFIATLMGGLAEMYFFSSGPSIFFHDRLEFARLFIYLCQGGVISLLFDNFHVAQKQILENEKELSHAFEQERLARGLAENSIRKLKTIQMEVQREREVAKEANQVKSLFLAHMSHEIRTPLSAVLGFADLLKDKNLNEAERIQYVQIIERTGKNLKEIIDDILDLSKVESGHFEIDPHSFCLDELICEIFTTFSLKCSEKSVYLSIDPCGEISEFIKADSKRLRQILINLIGNSIKFTSQGSVKIIYSIQKNELVFRIKDTGVGITASQRTKLFANFSQGDNSVCRNYDGTGLGLALSRKLARMMGGDVELISSVPGKGSVFEARIPFEVGENVKKISVLTKSIETIPNCAGKKILVVDDSQDNRFLLELFLKKVGCEVSEAQNGQEALEMTKNQTFDLILLDMQMPVMDGYTTANYLRENNCATPVIALTAHALKEDRQKCLEAGCHGYLSKPLQKSELYEILQVYCSSYVIN